MTEPTTDPAAELRRRVGGIYDELDAITTDPDYTLSQVLAALSGLHHDIGVSVVALSRTGEAASGHFPRPTAVAAKAAELITRKQAGDDCDQDESAWIKGYFDYYHPIETPQGAAMADAYPLEKDDWYDELEQGFRNASRTISGHFSGNREKDNMTKPTADHVRPTLQVNQSDNGAILVELRIPGCESVLELSLYVELQDEAWVVSIPWPEDIPEGTYRLPDGHEVCNGILYVGTPED